MLVGVQRDLADPGDELGEGRVAGQIGPQHEGVEEQPDHALGLRAAAVGDRGPGHHVVGVGVAAQQDRERAEERDEHRGAGAQGQLPQAGSRRFGHLEADDPAVRRPHGRAGPVGGQLQRWCPCQPLAPVGQSGRGRLAVQPVALPEREIGVLGGQRLQRGRLAAPEGVVEGGELAVEDPDRPFVRDDVVQAQAEHVVAGADDDQRPADQRPGGEVERRQRVRADQPSGLLGGVGAAGEVRARERERDRRVDDLVGDPVACDQPGAQRLVPFHQRVQRRPQGRLVQVAGQPHREGHVVLDGPGFELVQEPQAFLGE
ncbi:hypothetical protein GCM10009727_00080 [Actinomadura napierensis]|uniref:Uncharacterized protein n=1 Tax=Actinomadura napierensis TaxID=267854 RepID=A0ABP5JGA1_9ACTN